MAQWVKNLPAMQETRETQVQLLGQEDPLDVGTQPRPVFMPVEPHGLRSLVGYRLNCHKDLHQDSYLQRRSRFRYWVLGLHHIYIFFFGGGTIQTITTILENEYTTLKY